MGIVQRGDQGIIWGRGRLSQRLFARRWSDAAADLALHNAQAAAGQDRQHDRNIGKRNGGAQLLSAARLYVAEAFAFSVQLRGSLAIARANLYVVTNIPKKYMLIKKKLIKKKKKKKKKS